GRGRGHGRGPRAAGREPAGPRGAGQAAAQAGHWPRVRDVLGRAVGQAAMDRILLQGMRFWGHHGLLPHEREQGQPFEVDLEVELDLSRARESDRLEETVDYRLLFRAVQEVVEGEPVHLLEHLAERIRRQVERTLEALPV